MMEDLDSLKHDPRVLQIYMQYTRLKKEGNLWKGVCPLHSEKTGSFVVYPDMKWTDYGGCGTGNIFQLIEKKDGCTFKDAVEKVKKILGESTSTWQRDAAAVDATFHNIQEAPKTFKTYTLSEYAGFEKNLPEAVHFLDRRGISLETARRLHLGYRKSVGKLAGEKNQDIADSGWLAMPRIEGDTVVGIHYRSVVEGRKAFCRQPGMQTALFNTATIDMFDSLYVVEGEMDSCVLEQAGYRSISIPSASTNLTPAQKDQLMAAGTVILAGDCDDGPGTEKMNKLWRELSERTYLLKWPAGMKDANQTLLEHCGGDYEKFKEEVDRLTQQAKTMPLPDVYSLTESMLAQDDTSLSDRPDRLRFPWPSVDEMAILLPGSILTLFATQTGTGKTAFAMEVTLHNAVKYERSILNYQCELSATEFSTMAAANTLKKNRNFLKQEDFKQAYEALGNIQYYIGYDPSIQTVGPALDLIEAAIRRLGCGIVCIDHIHFLCRNESNEVQALANAMQRIKRMARTYKCIFIVVGQPRKPTQQARGKQVHLADAKGSETFGSDSDAMMALHREIVKSDDSGPSKDGLEPKTKVVLLKARSKGIGNSEAELIFFGEYASFSEMDFGHENYAE
jgi:hypothetical protein